MSPADAVLYTVSRTLQLLRNRGNGVGLRGMVASPFKFVAPCWWAACGETVAPRSFLGTCKVVLCWVAVIMYRKLVDFFPFFINWFCLFHLDPPMIQRMFSFSFVSSCSSPVAGFWGSPGSLVAHTTVQLLKTWEGGGVAPFEDRFGVFPYVGSSSFRLALSQVSPLPPSFYN